MQQQGQVRPEATCDLIVWRRCEACGRSHEGTKVCACGARLREPERKRVPAAARIPWLGQLLLDIGNWFWRLVEKL